MATLHGKKLTAAQYKALQNKWAVADKKHWKAAKRAEIERVKKHIAKLKSSQRDMVKKYGKSFPLTARLITKHEDALKKLQAEYRKL